MMFKTARRDGTVWVEPRPAAFHLTPSKHRAKTTDRAGTASDTDGTPGEDADDPTGNVSDPPVEYAKDRARDRLKRLTNSVVSSFETLGGNSTA